MYIKVHCIPGAKKERLKKESDTIYYIQVKEPALRNLANKRVLQLLAAELSLNRGKLRLVSGHRSSIKILNVEL